MNRAANWALWLPLALFAGLLLLVAGGLLRPASRDVQSAMVGKPLPDFVLKGALPGRPGLARVDFADGRPKLLNVFASWCVPCAVESPQLAQLKAAGARIEAVAIRDKGEDIASFLKRNGDPFDRIATDPVSSLQLAIGSSGVPETFVIDGRGVIRYQHIGDIRPENVAMLLGKLREAGR
ncbi:redoxin family protein [Parablastomonas sp. CN1-191]|uniref:redoxin family protein n=1 Tax=Parablastomonas sp. CN1-191 TaxID=3400908 RepID=UPI003BF8CD18